MAAGQHSHHTHLLPELTWARGGKRGAHIHAKLQSVLICSYLSQMGLVQGAGVLGGLWLPAALSASLRPPWSELNPALAERFTVTMDTKEGGQGQVRRLRVFPGTPWVMPYWCPPHWPQTGSLQGNGPQRKPDRYPPSLPISGLYSSAN